MLILVLGATSWLPREVARAGLARGHEVACLARGESGQAPPSGHLRARRPSWGDGIRAGVCPWLGRGRGRLVCRIWSPQHRCGSRSRLGLTAAGADPRRRPRPGGRAGPWPRRSGRSFSTGWAPADHGRPQM